MKTTPFDKWQVKAFVKEAKTEFGVGWAHIGARFQHAIIVERASYVMAGQVSETVKPDTISWLVSAMLAEAGISE